MRVFPLARLHAAIPLVQLFYTPFNFLETFLMPHVAVCLIMEDMQLLDMEAAYKIMLESAEFGSLFHIHNDDQEDRFICNLPFTLCI